MLEKVKQFTTKYEAYISPITLLGGFVFDNLTLRRVDLWAENLVIMIYLGIAVTAVVVLNMHESGWLKYRIFHKTPTALSLVLQFVFGGLFSAFFIFYSRSASLVGSWPFLLFLVLIMVGNEKFRGKYQRTTFQVSVLYIAIFSYLVFAMPIFLKQINTNVFIISGLTSLALMGVIALLFFLLMPKVFHNNKYSIAISVFSIYILFNFFYFFNLIPPIPLALKDSGIYHSVKRVGVDYEVLYEPSPWYDIFNEYKNTFSWKRGGPVYCYSSVFAPTKINTKIYHRWYWYDEANSKWIEKDRLGFEIAGGRDGGYRGYSLKYGVTPGEWKIDIENEQEQILGRVKFDIIENLNDVELKLKIKK